MPQIAPRFRTITDLLNEVEEPRRHQSPIEEDEVKSLIGFVDDIIQQNSSGTCLWTSLLHTDHVRLTRSMDGLSHLPRTLTTYMIKDIPPQIVYYCINDPIHRKSFDSGLARFTVARRIDDCLDVVVSEVHAPLGIANREFIEWRRRMKSKSSNSRTANVYITQFRSCSETECLDTICLKGKRVQRGETWLSAYVIKWWLDENMAPIGATMHILSQVDPKGNVPKQLPRSILVPQAKKWLSQLTAHAHELCEKKGVNCSMSDDELEAKVSLN